MKVFTDKGTIEDIPDIVHPIDSAYFTCPCGGDAFRISYGEYTCLGTCIVCGKVLEVYSG